MDRKLKGLVLISQTALQEGKDMNNILSATCDLVTQSRLLRQSQRFMATLFPARACELGANECDLRGSAGNGCAVS